LLLGPEALMSLYFCALFALIAVSIWLLAVSLAATATVERISFANLLLAALVGIEVLLLPVNHGILVANKVAARVASATGDFVPQGKAVWRIWDGKTTVTFLIADCVDAAKRRLVTLTSSKVEHIEVIGFEPIVKKLFGAGGDICR
jgi:hypothetical protein